MEIHTTLQINAADFTVSRLTVNAAFECWTLEDEGRVVKVPGETRIPAGRFRIVLRKEGPMHERYAKRFGAMHKGMLWIQDVPGFEFIYIHIGNTDEDTRGCLLVGERYSDAGTLMGSERAYRRLYARIAAALECGEPVWITITRRPEDAKRIAA